MGDPQQVVSLLVAGVLGGVGLWWSRRALRKAGVGTLSTQVIGNLRELADSWEAKYELERDEHAVTKAALATSEAARRLCEGDLFYERDRKGRNP